MLCIPSATLTSLNWKDTDGLISYGFLSSLLILTLFTVWLLIPVSLPPLKILNSSICLLYNHFLSFLAFISLSPSSTTLLSLYHKKTLKSFLWCPAQLQILRKTALFFFHFKNTGVKYCFNSYNGNKLNKTTATMSLKTSKTQLFRSATHKNHCNTGLPLCHNTVCPWFVGWPLQDNHHWVWEWGWKPVFLSRALQA